MDIDDELEPPTVYSYDVSHDMDNLVREVLKGIPDSYSEEFPSFSVFEAYSAWDAHVEREDIEEVANVICDPRLLKMPKDVAIGILAHEFAH